MRVQHGRVIDMFFFAGHCRFNSQQLRINIRAVQRGTLRRQIAHIGRSHSAGIHQARHFYTSFPRQICDESGVQHIAADFERHIGFNGFENIRSILMRAFVMQRCIIDQLLTHLLPLADLLHTAARIFVQRNLKAFDQLRIALFDEIGMIFRIML
ncbi:hypothetical protein D3C75_704220 [compost metagenome]